MQEEYSSGRAAPEVSLLNSEVEYAQVRPTSSNHLDNSFDLQFKAQRVVMQSVMRSSKVSAGGMVRKTK